MKDILGQELKVGDRVVYSYPDWCALKTGTVTRICPKTLYIRPDEQDPDYITPDENRHPNGVVKVK